MKAYFLFPFIASMIFSACDSGQKKIPVVKEGFLDLSEWRFERDGIISLNGTWEFYWKKLYTPGHFAHHDTVIRDRYIQVPGSWRGESFQGNRISGKGFATYRMVIYIPQAIGKSYGLHIMDCYSSYRCFVNGSEIAHNGVVSQYPAEMKPQFLPQQVTFTADADSLNIIFQVANNFTYEGGLWQSIRLGTSQQILKQSENTKFSTLFFIGVLFVLIIYHLFIYFLRQTEWSAFWFAVLVFIGLLRTLIVGERLFYQAFPNFPLGPGYKIEYIDFIPLTTVFLLFIYNLNRIYNQANIVKWYVWITLAEILLVTLSPVYFFSSLLPFFIVVMVAGLMLSLFFIYQNIKAKQKGFKLLFGVSCFVIIAAVNDVLYSLQIINTFFFAHYFFGLLLLAQAYLLALRFASSYNTIEHLSAELNLVNISLEKKVIERTHELEVEKKKSDDLLLNILPSETAAELKQHGRSKAKTYSMVTVMFADFKDFTVVSERVSAELLVAEIDFCFSAFDGITQKYNIEKIKTIGDAYLCASGLPVLSFTHAEDTINAAIEIRNFMQERKKEKDLKGEHAFEIRIGIHTGPVVAGIVGVRKFAFDIWGDTVNVAARMETSSETGKVNISGFTCELVKDKFNCVYRGKIQAKNKGEIDMYFVENSSPLL